MQKALRILVTGGAGFIGSAVVRRLIAGTPYEVCVVDKLTYAGNLESLAPASASPRYSFVRADVTDRARMAELVQSIAPDRILHLAAETHVDRSIDSAAEFIATNVVGTFSLLDALLPYWRSMPSGRREAFRFVHVSTDEVFGSLQFDDPCFTEESPYRPSSPYAASKAASDHLVRAWHLTHGLPIVVSNCSNNYGPYHFPEKLIPLTVLNCLEGKPIAVYGRGENVRDWLYVVDHARALILLAERGVPGETYTVGGDAQRSNISVVRSICRMMDEMLPDAAEGRRERLIDFVADRPGHDLRYAIDAGKIRRELGWRPERDFESRLATTIRWYIDNRPWWERIRSGVYRGERLGRSV